MSARDIARHSCYDQMHWPSGEGRVTAENVKAALLSVGTRGRFTVYKAHGGTPHSIDWRLGIAYLNNLRRGWYAHG